MSINPETLENSLHGANIENDNNSDDDDDGIGLQIVLESPTPVKRKSKLELNETDKQVIACVEKDLEETLEEKAEKAKLTATNVKNILKHVVSNEDVVALIRHFEDPEKVEKPTTVYEPKFTRAKTKELLSNTDETIWKVPKSVQVSETQLLISEELQEDSSGDEYIPETPNTNKSAEDDLEASLLSNDNDDGDEANVGGDDVATIALRTRSKYNLSDQKLEEIESAFMPPDITTDMYDMDCDDDVWREFLKTFTKPLDEVAKLPEDEEQDPEYNILADEEEIDEVDTEELRADRAVTISKKEVNNLMAELFEFVDFYEARKLEKPPIRIDNNIIDNNSNNNSNNKEKIVEEKEVVLVVKNNQVEQVQQQESIMDINPTMVDKHWEILQQQIRQHIQLLTQHFLLTYEHPEFGYMAIKFKKCLEEFKERSNGNPQSFFNSANLCGALELVENWEIFFKSDNCLVKETKDYVKKVLERIKMVCQNSNFRPTFPPILVEKIFNSNVFIYPHLLPRIPFKPYTKHSRQFINPENHLIAIFLEQMIPLLKKDPSHINKMKTVTIRHVCHYIRNLLMPNLTWQKIERHIRRMRYLDIDNPIRYYFQNKQAPPVVHKILPFDPNRMLTPSQLKLDDLPYVWKRYVITKRQKLRSLDTQTIIVTPLISNSDESPRQFIVNLPQVPIEKKHKSCKRLLFKERIKQLEEMLPDMPSLSNPSLKQTPIRNEIDENDVNQTNEQEIATNFQLEQEQQQSQPKPSPVCEIRTNFQDIELSSSQIIFSNLNPTEKDNPNDINELMVASATVKNVRKEPSGAEKKRAKIRREFLANLAMATPETPESKAENDANFAVAYFDKLKETLSDEDYNNILQVFNDFHDHGGDFTEFYNKIQTILSPKYKELSEEFLLFLTTYQANKVGKLMSHLLMKDLSNFMKKVAIYYKDQPLQMRKFLKCLNDLSHISNLTIDTVKSTFLPLFKGNEILTELFVQIFPNERPSQLLINGPYEVVDLKNETSRQPDDEIYETIVVPDTEDPYGSANCICECHNVDNQQFKLRSNHCKHCGLKFIQGKPYIQTGKGLRPAVVSFLTNPDKDHTKRLMAVQRKRSDSLVKQNSPNKEQNHDDNRNSNESEDEVDGNKKKRQRKVKHGKSAKNPTLKPCDKLKETKSKTEILKKPPKKRVIKKKSPKYKLGSNSGQIKRLIDEPIEVHEQSDSDSEICETSQDLTNTDSDNGSESSSIGHNRKDSWTRDEDKIILQTFQQRKSNEETFQHIAQLLPNRSVVEIKTRFRKLMALLQEMAPKSV